MTDVTRLIDDAIQAGNMEAVRGLFSRYPEMAHFRYCGQSWLHAAVQFQKIEIARLLIDLGCDVRSENDSGNRLTPLDNAIFRDNPDLVRLLLTHGANPNHSREVISAIVGMKRNSLKMIQLLAEHGADLHRVFENEQSHQPMNALSEAIAWGKQDVVDFLRSQGAVLPEQQPPAAQTESTVGEVLRHFAENVGAVDKLAVIEIVRTDPPIRVHAVPADAGHDCVTLFTSGMSSRPMTVPADFPHSADYRLAELFIQLPPDWPYRDLHNPLYNWPVRWLQWLSKYPHQQGTWLGGPVAIVDESDPPVAIGPNVRFNSMMAMAERRFERSDGQIVQLYRLTPLHPEERELERREGLDVLLRTLDAHDTPLVVDPNRPPATGNP